MGAQPFTDEEFDRLHEKLRLERDFSNETLPDQVKRTFAEHAGEAAVAICKLAVHSQSERVRLAASSYVVERIIGRIQDDPPAPPEDPIMQMLKEVSEYVKGEAEAKDANT